MYAFVHINKTGGKTLARILRREFGLAHCDVEPWGVGGNRHLLEAADLRRYLRLNPCIRCISGHGIRPVSDLDQVAGPIHYLTILREPARRYAAHFAYVVNRFQPRMTIDDWLSKEKYHNLQCRVIAGQASASAAIEVIEARFVWVGVTERYAESMFLLEKVIGVPGFKAHYPDYYSGRQRCRFAQYVFRDRPLGVRLGEDLACKVMLDAHALERIEEVNREDQALYQHVLQVVFPRLRKQSGPHFEAEFAAFQERKKNSRPFSGLNASRLARVLYYKPAIWLWRCTFGRGR